MHIVPFPVHHTKSAKINEMHKKGDRDKLMGDIGML